MCTFAESFCLSGFASCEDKSDQDATFCQSYECPYGYSKCKDGSKCIYNSAFCNGKADCDGEQQLVHWLALRGWLTG